MHTFQGGQFWAGSAWHPVSAPRGFTHGQQGLQDNQVGDSGLTGCLHGRKHGTGDDVMRAVWQQQKPIWQVLVEWHLSRCCCDGQRPPGSYTLGFINRSFDVGVVQLC